MDNQNSMARWVSLSIIAAAFIISGTIIYTSKNNGPSDNNNNNNQPPATVKVSVDDDAVLGSVSAPVTMIEFSDYECPFCKRHFEEVYPAIKKDYIDTGKLKLVFRDFVAVPSHNPLATTEAEAAQCAKDQGGDTAYYAFHDQVFAKTTSNGKGLAVSQLPVIATSVGLNTAQFKQCLDSRKFKAEVEKDNADARSYLPPNNQGTPSFFVGKSTANGLIDGELIVGAQPYETFKVAIEKVLAK